MGSVVFAVVSLQIAAVLCLFGVGFRARAGRCIKVFTLADAVGALCFFALRATAKVWVPGSIGDDAETAELSALFGAVLVVLSSSVVLLLRVLFSQSLVARSEKRSNFSITVGGTLGFYGILALTGIYRAVTTPEIYSLPTRTLVDELLSNAPPSRRMQALIVLQDRGPERVTPAIVARLEGDIDPQLLKSEGLIPLFRLLGEWKEADTVPLLRVWLQRDLPPISWTQAAWSLSRLGHRDVIPFVEERLRSSDARWFEVTPQLLEILAYLDAEGAVPTIAIQLQGAAAIQGEVAEAVVQNALLALIAIDTSESAVALREFAGVDSGSRDAVNAILKQVGREPIE